MMNDIVKETFVEAKNGKITLTVPHQDYVIYEYIDGLINIVPIEKKKSTLMERLDRAVANFKRRIVSPPINLDYFKGKQ